MPTYEYNCTACGNDFERFESITARPNKVCPECNKKKAVRRISSGGGLIFKGSGFYATDYKKVCGKGSDMKETKTEVKAAAKTERKAAGCEGCPHSTAAKN